MLQLFLGLLELGARVPDQVLEREGYELGDEEEAVVEARNS